MYNTLFSSKIWSKERVPIVQRTKIFPFFQAVILDTMGVAYTSPGVVTADKACYASCMSVYQNLMCQKYLILSF